MDFRLTAEQTAFQSEVNGFIAHGLPSGWDVEHESLEDRLAV